MENSTEVGLQERIQQILPRLDADGWRPIEEAREYFSQRERMVVPVKLQFGGDGFAAIEGDSCVGYVVHWLDNSIVSFGWSHITHFKPLDVFISPEEKSTTGENVEHSNRDSLHKELSDSQDESDSSLCEQSLHKQAAALLREVLAHLPDASHLNGETQ